MSKLYKLFECRHVPSETIYVGDAKGILFRMDELIKTVRKRIKRAGVTKSLVSELADIPRGQFNYWTNGVGTLTTSQIARVSDILNQIEHAATVFDNIGLELNWRSADFVRQLLKTVREVETQQAQQELETVLGEAASVFNLTLS
jgi:hypothetical protein